MAEEHENNQPGTILDAIRDREDWDDQARSNALNDLIARFAPIDLIKAIRPRLKSLGGRDGSTLIELIEGLSEPDLLVALADALADQPDLPPDVSWLALDVLEGTGLVDDRSELRMLRDELEDLAEGDDPLEELAAQIAEDPDSAFVAMEGLAQLDPDTRREIIEGLGQRAFIEPIRAFLRLLADRGDPAIRDDVRAALGDDFADEPSRGIAVTSPTDHWRESLVGPIDGEGRALILVRAEHPSGEQVAKFLCDVRLGIAEGILLDPEADAGLPYLGSDAILNRHELAWRLLGASAWLSGDSISEDAQEALAFAIGSILDPQPILAVGVSPEDSSSIECAEDDAASILDRRPEWLDRSPLVRELAIAGALRDEIEPPDPRREPGPFRMLFEGRILGRIDLYRRMLLWSALGWDAQGEPELAASARRLASQINEPQNAVPGHPFLAELMIRSLSAAMERLRSDS